MNPSSHMVFWHEEWTILPQQSGTLSVAAASRLTWLTVVAQRCFIHANSYIPVLQHAARWQCLLPLRVGWQALLVCHSWWPYLTNPQLRVTTSTERVCLGVYQLSSKPPSTNQVKRSSYKNKYLKAPKWTTGLYRFIRLSAAETEKKSGLGYLI